MHNLVLLEPLESAFYYEKIYDYYDLSGEGEEKEINKGVGLEFGKGGIKKIYLIKVLESCVIK